MSESNTPRVALVTGASGGIGAAIAKQLHKAGMHVVLSGRKQAELDALAQQLGSRATVRTADLSQADAADALVSGIEKDLGGVDVLINNAGLTKDGLMMRMKDEDFAQVLEVNLVAGFRLSRASIRGMIRKRYGRIVSISSIVGVMGNAGQANYAASKAGLIGMSKSLAAEVASRGVTVNVVAPGFIETAMTHVLNDEQKGKLMTQIPMGRMGSADDIANAVAFLASDAASYITGQTIHVNGGMLMI